MATAFLEIYYTKYLKISFKKRRSVNTLWTDNLAEPWTSLWLNIHKTFIQLLERYMNVLCALTLGLILSD